MKKDDKKPIKTVAKKTKTVQSKSEVKRMNVVKKSVDTFQDWWDRNSTTFSDSVSHLMRYLGVSKRTATLRKDFGLHLSEKDLCQKIWDEYK